MVCVCTYIKCTVCCHRSAILNDVAVSSRRSKQHVTKTLLVLGKRGGVSIFIYILCMVGFI